MTDFQTMRNRINRDLTRDEITAVASDEIKTAILYYERQRFWFLEKRATLNTVDSQEFYALPSDFQDDDSLVINVNNWTYPLIKRTYATIEAWFVRSATFTGYPTDWCIYNEQIRLYPIPNAAFTMTLSYLKSTAVLTNNSDTNEWMVEGEELIRCRASRQICATKLKDLERAAVYQQLETDALRQFNKITMTRLMTGHARRRRTGRVGNI